MRCSVEEVREFCEELRNEAILELRNTQGRWGIPEVTRLNQRLEVLNRIIYFIDSDSDD